MEWWRTTGYEDNVVRTGRHAIVSVQPADTTEATKMAHVLAGQSELKGVEINWSCPNVKQQTGPDLLADLVRSFRDNCPHPVGVKLADTACLRYCEAVDGEVEWFDLINTVPWSNLYPDRPSPLARLGGGGVSGPAISARSKYALRAVANNFQTPVISGGGIWSLDDARERFAMGAAAITIGTLFLSRPWRPTRIARQIRSGATAR
jgi:dihydroorotate dehydrogenase